MKRNALTLVVGIILLLIFFLLLFTFQVRQTEVVLVTTFAKPSATPITEPGLYFKWPQPIQKVYRFDKRIHSIEDEFDQMLTFDGNNLLANVYVGWTIERPLEFFSSFAAGTPEAAEPSLKAAIRQAKHEVIGKHPFSDFISSDPKQLKFTDIENEMLNGIRQAALERYGIKIHFLGFKRLGLPESVTAKVFDRMTQERSREIESLRAQGDKEATAIKSLADSQRSEIISKAQAEATRIRGDAEAKAAESYEVLKQNQDLAIFILEMQALEHAMNKGTTLIVDRSTPPFNRLVTEPARGDNANGSQTNRVELSSNSGGATNGGGSK
jgi:membrane protease subunit HflC